MDALSPSEKNGVQAGITDDAVEHMSIDGIVSLLSLVESGIQQRNPIAAYFLGRCKCALLQDALNRQGPARRSN
jgi:hypothetical protein